MAFAVPPELFVLLRCAREDPPLVVFFGCKLALLLDFDCFRDGDCSSGGAGNASALGSKAAKVDRGVKGDVAAVEADLSRAFTGSSFNVLDLKSIMTLIMASREVVSKVTNLKTDGK
jgi:hypothetical protein